MKLKLTAIIFMTILGGQALALNPDQIEGCVPLNQWADVGANPYISISEIDSRFNNRQFRIEVQYPADALGTSSEGERFSSERISSVNEFGNDTIEFYMDKINLEIDLESGLGKYFNGRGQNHIPVRCR